MRSIIVPIVVSFLFLTPNFSWAAIQNADVQACGSSDFAKRISGCTRILESGQLPKHALWAAYWQRGQGYSGISRFDAAISDFTKSIALKPNSLTYSNRGNAYVELEKYDQAHKDFDQALLLDPKNHEAYQNKAFAYTLKGDLDRAIPLYGKSLEIKKDARTYNARGLAWQGKRKFDQALADYDEAIRLNPKDADPYINLANLYREQGEFDRALSYLDQVVRLYPDSAKAYNNRALNWSSKGDNVRAFADIERALAIDPNNSVIYRVRGKLFNDTGDYDRAIADYGKSLRLAPGDASGVYGRAVAFQKKGDLDKALADFDRFVVAEPENPAGYSGRGSVLSARGSVDLALKDFAKSIEIDPERAVAFVDRGETFEKIGDIERARDDYKTAVKLPRVRYLGSRVLVSTTEDYLREQETAKARLIVLDGAPSFTTPNPIPEKSASATTSKVESGRRLALVIGNGAYQNASPLPNPPNDARGVAKNLRDIGFDVSEGIDLDKEKLHANIVSFLRDSVSANLALVFYAGHGMQIDGKNYLVPVDARFDNSSELVTSMTDMDTILAALDGKLRTNIIILDACRDNPLGKKEITASVEPSRSVKVRSGLAAPNTIGAGTMAGAGTMIAFATAPGQVALDGEGSNSPFSTALIRHVGTPNLEIQQMMTRVRADVVSSTKGKQVPWSNSALIGEVYLTNK